MKTTRIVFFSLLTFSFSPLVNADFVGLNIGTNRWVPDISGSFNSSNDSSIETGNDLGYSDHTSIAMTISIEHPVPVVPNFRYQGYDLNASSQSTLDNDVTFNGSTYYTGSDVNSTLDLSHNDIALYYQLLDNWINLDLGLDFKMFDGKVSINNDAPIDVDETIPMLYFSARVDLPLTGFYVGANIQPYSLGDSSSEDSSLLIGYESRIGLGFEGGIKSFSLDLEDVNDLNTNLEYDGIFLNGYFNF